MQVQELVNKFVGTVTEIVESRVRERVLSLLDGLQNGHDVKKPKPPVQAKPVVPLAKKELQRKKWREAKRARRKLAQKKAQNAA